MNSYKYYLSHQSLPSHVSCPLPSSSLPIVKEYTHHLLSCSITARIYRLFRPCNHRRYDHSSHCRQIIRPDAHVSSSNFTRFRWHLFFEGLFDAPSKPCKNLLGSTIANLYSSCRLSNSNAYVNHCVVLIGNQSHKHLFLFLRNLPDTFPLFGPTLSRSLETRRAAAFAELRDYRNKDGRFWLLWHC